MKTVSKQVTTRITIDLGENELESLVKQGLIARGMDIPSGSEIIFQTNSVGSIQGVVIKHTSNF